MGTEAGKVYILTLLVAHDIGRAINPTKVEGQLEGAITPGIGYALTEDYYASKQTGVVATYKKRK